MTEGGSVLAAPSSVQDVEMARASSEPEFRPTNISPSLSMGTPAAMPAPSAGSDGFAVPPPYVRREKGGQAASACVHAAASTAAGATAQGQTEDATKAAPVRPTQPAQGAAPPAAMAYDPPDWGGAPEGVPYTLEVLKGGQITEQHAVSAKGHYLFGRAPTCDFVLDHPSSSRLHAVLQYNQRTGAATILDNGSTHGTFLNKARVDAKVYTPLAVGDTLRFGQSSRLYLFGGPSDLMPAEGLTRQQRRQVAQMELAQRQKKRDEELGRQQMATAVSGGASWGMGGDDALDEDMLAAGTVDWRSYAATHPLNERQQKTADKIRQRELKMKNMRTECDRITAKEKQENGLTAGQASTLARNEQGISKLAEEIEELDDELDDSVKDALSDKLKAKEQKAGGAPKRKKTSASDDEYASGSDTDDEFYDRTAAGGATAAVARKHKVKKAAPVVESAETLHGKREALLDERQRLTTAIADEERRVSGAAATTASAAAGGVSPGVAPPPASPVPAVGASAEDVPAVDSLDAYLTALKTRAEQDQLGTLRKELGEAEQQLARTERLLKFVDPDGWFRPGAKSAAAVKLAALKAMEAERLKKADAVAAAAAKKAEQDSKPFVPEEEEEDGPLPPGAVSGADGVSSAGTASALLIQRPRPAVTVLKKGGAIVAAGTSKYGLQILRPAPPAAVAVGETAAASRSTGARAVPAGVGGGVNAVPTAETQQRHAAAKDAAAQLMRDFSGRDETGELLMSQKGGVAGGAQPGGVGAAGVPPCVAETAAAARVAADIAALSAARRGGQSAAADLAASETEATWVPPSGQTGDGRSALNDRLGY